MNSSNNEISSTSDNSSSEDKIEEKRISKPQTNNKITIKAKKLTKKQLSIDNRDKVLMEYFDRKFEELIKSVSFNGNTIEEIKKDTNKLNKGVKKIKGDHESIKNRVTELERDVHLLKQNTKKNLNENKDNNSIIIGLNPKTNEEAKNEAKKVFDFLYVATEDYTARILPSKNPVMKPVLIVFKNQENKKILFQNRKKKRKVESTSCDISGEQRNKARALKESGYKSLWCSRGQAFCKQIDDSKSFLIKDDEQLDNLITKATKTKSKESEINKNQKD